MPFWKEITKPFREVVRAVPFAGPSAVKGIRETARVADQVTALVQEPVKGLVNDVTGARKRENTRLDNQKQQFINESRNRILAQRAEGGDVREIMAKQINVLREAIQQAERENGEVEAEAAQIPNLVFAYEECSLGRTEEIALMLQPNEDYDLFMGLNPLNEAYLSYIESNINIDALRMLSEHNHPSINASKTELSANVWANIDTAIADQHFEKVKRIILAFIQFEGEGAFLERVRGHAQVHQPLINAAILRNNNGIVFGELHGGPALAPRAAPKPRP